MKTSEFRKLYKDIVTRAWEDVNFKNELLSKPLETVEKINKYGLNFEDKKIIVEDQSDSNKIYLNIPQKIDFENLELSEEQLEKVAGGGFFDFFLAIFLGKVQNKILKKKHGIYTRTKTVRGNSTKSMGR